MFRKILIAAAAVSMIAAATQSASAGVKWNGITYQGVSLNGVQPNGVASVAPTGVTLLAIELPQVSQ